MEQSKKEITKIEHGSLEERSQFLVELEYHQTHPDYGFNYTSWAKRLGSIEFKYIYSNNYEMHVCYKYLHSPNYASDKNDVLFISFGEEYVGKRAGEHILCGGINYEIISN